MIQGPTISLSPQELPWYAAQSLFRMMMAYALSLIFTLFYGMKAAYNPRARQILLPVLDVLQSVPILSFLPVVLLSLTAILPQTMAIELGSIILIFTSQAWNLTFAWYQSLTTLPGELGEASQVFGFYRWMRFKTLELPFAAINLIWNSMMSWAGGWFFLMAAEIFTVGSRDFRLPGLGSYLAEAAHQGDTQAILWGLGALILMIVILDQFIWRPLLAWSERFKLTMVEGASPPTSWFYHALRSSHGVTWLRKRFWQPARARIDDFLMRKLSHAVGPPKPIPVWLYYGIIALFGAVLLYGAFQAFQLLASVSLREWESILIGLAATTLRVLAALLITLLWAVPLGVAIGTNSRLAAWLQPLVQILASIPATALFPILLLFVIGLPGGLSTAAILFMLMGTQWYLLFNIIAGAAAIPQDLKYTSALLQLSRWARWRTLILPSLFPYLITGAITASGGAWNSSIVAEYVQFGGKTIETTGIGAIIAQATSSGRYPMLLAATLSMILAVVSINRFVWRRLYRLGAERFSLE
ncbi:ABC transporter permease subunit [Candidatus Acetothermia bacterium]|nr:ABC transporter permease subunit [Candidatus Acetothermia bacterium]MBI3644310.1 ABC transporter permease subunit [Candidatus Acetothermia bacterium]